ncbi:MAG TPA: hypothetical protein VMU90_00525 [Solirubrobacteraceae bacterium]|nr:hypothetical protein [Solirubrobacteraceae bacterium]
MSLADREASYGAAVLFERTSPRAAPRPGDPLPNSAIPNSVSAGEEQSYLRATFSLGERELDRLAVMELELRRQGKRATKSEIVALALEAALKDFEEHGMGSEIVGKLSGSLRRR